MNEPAIGPGAELCSLGVTELASLYRSRSVSPVEVTRAVLDRIDRLNPQLNAYITVLPEQAMAAAKAAEQQLAAGIDLGPLQGIPFSVKDLINASGSRTTAASKILQDAPLETEDATVVKRLRASGAILVGKNNLHEFAYGDPDPSSPFGVVQNPRRLGHQSGSSSSGSAAAVAAGLGPLSLGSDTGGSVRHPASVCGVVGLKPTQGLVSVRGVIPLSTSMDCIGPIARSVADAAVAMASIAGYDPNDPHSVPSTPVDYPAAIGRDLRGLRLGVPTNAIYRFGSAEALEFVDVARKALVELGLAPISLELPRAEETNDLCSTLSVVDLWAYHEQHLDKEALYGRALWKRAEPGRHIPAVQYAKAVVAMQQIRRLWMDLFERVDLLLLPGNVVGAPPHGQDWADVDGEQVPVRLATSRFNRVSNVTGMPAISVPVGRLSNGLPVGVQLVGPHFGEARLLSVAHALEQALGNPVRRWGIEPVAG